MMNRLRLCSGMLLLLGLSGCALQQADDYEQWREFHSAVAAMSTEERRERSAQLNARYDQTPTTMVSLQLAYLVTLDTAGTPDRSADERVAELLRGVRDDHALVPVRDMLRQQLQLREHHYRARQQLGDARRELGTVKTSLDEARDQCDALAREIDTCTDQLQALKEIESMMSSPDDSVEPQP